jgi:hypothetical protein
LFNPLAVWKIDIAWSDIDMYMDIIKRENVVDDKKTMHAMTILNRIKSTN